MPCILGCLALGFPRLVLFVVGLFQWAYLNRAFSSWLWLALGFFFFPLTTLAYVYAYNSIGLAGEVSFTGWLLIAFAAAVDVGLLGGSARGARRRA